MTLTQMLQTELRREIKEGENSYQTYENTLHVLSSELGIPLSSLHFFINQKNVATDGTISHSMLNTLFDRYRTKIINPIKSGQIRTLYNDTEKTDV